MRRMGCQTSVQNHGALVFFFFLGASRIRLGTKQSLEEMGRQNAKRKQEASEKEDKLKA